MILPAILSKRKNLIRFFASLRMTHPIDRASVAILVLAALLLFARLDDRDLWPSHEARAAQEAQNLLETPHWGVLHLFDGTPDYQKPPLYYWLVAATGWLRGGVIDAWAVRLPAAFAGWWTIAMVHGWLRRRGRPLAGCVAATALLCAHHFLATSRTGRIDAPLMLCVAGAILSKIDGKTWRAGAFLTAAILLKGPIGAIAVVPVLSINRRRPQGFVLATIAAALAAPWFAFATIESHGEFAREFFWHHNFERATGASGLVARPWWFYLAHWVVDWLPATPALVMAIWFAVRQRLWKSDGELRLGLIWMLAITLLLSLSRFKRADYLMMAYPGAAIMVGCVAEWRLARQGFRRLFLVFGSGTIVAAMIGALAYEFTVLPRDNRQFEKQSFAQAISSFRTPSEPVVFFQIEDHLLAFHVGQPLVSIQNWDALDELSANPGRRFVVLPADLADSWPDHICAGTLREVTRHHDVMRSRWIVVMESQSNSAVALP